MDPGVKKKSLQINSTKDNIIAKISRAADASTASVAASTFDSAPTSKLLPSPNAIASPFDCSSLAPDKDPHFVVYSSPKHNVSTVADVSWWHGNKNPQQTMGDQTMVDLLLDETLKDEVYIDVGANVGQTAFWGLVTGRPTFAFDPLEFDMTKLCTGLSSTVDRGFATKEDSENKFLLYRALVGNESVLERNISRPEDSFGKFEQASMASNTIGVARKPKLVVETVPMVTLDSVIPENMPVGMVKIDVQGAEIMVVQGMKNLLSRTSGYPVVIYYEEQKRVTTGAGYEMGAVQKFLEGYGYTCGAPGNDITCRKSRQPQSTS